MRKIMTHEGPAKLSAVQASTPSPEQSMSFRQRLVYILILGAATALGPFTIDLYLPAFPTLTQEFHTQMTVIQLTLTGTTTGFAAGQLFMGPLSDRFGRKPLLMISTALHLAASLGVATAGTIEILTLMRVLQGIGASGSAVVVMAMVRDLFSGQQLVRMLSRMALVSGLAPIIGPFVGSQLLSIMPWHGLFIFLAVYAATLLCALGLFIRETYTKTRRKEHNSTALERYRTVLSDRKFLVICVISGLNFTGIFAYISQSSFIFQQVYGLSAQQYGFLFAANSLGFAVGVQAAARLLKKYTQQRIISISISFMLLCALTMLLGNYFFPAVIWAFIVPLWCYMCCAGLAIPCIQTLALAQHSKQAGTAASILGTANYGTSGIAGPLAGALSGIFSQVASTAVLMASCMSLALLSLLLMLRKPTRGHFPKQILSEV